MIYGYALVTADFSTVNLAVQINILTEYGCEHIVSETRASVTAEREDLNKIIDNMAVGDTLVVMDLKYLGHDLDNLSSTLKQIHSNSGHLVALNFNGAVLDTRKPFGRLVMSNTRHVLSLYT